MLGERGLGIFKANLLVFQIFYTGIFRATSFGDGGGVWLQARLNGFIYYVRNVLSRTSNGLGFTVSIQTNRTFYMSFEVFPKAPCRQKHIRLLFAILRKPSLN